MSLRLIVYTILIPLPLPIAEYHRHLSELRKLVLDSGRFQGFRKEDYLGET